jgi:hypothetical protein
MAKPIYVLKAARNGRGWAIDVRELRAVRTQARRLDQVESAGREAIAVTLQTATDSFDVAVQVDAASLGALQATVEDALRAREASDQAQSRASEAMRRAVHEIRSAGYTARDAGMLLGVSNQRISQIERQVADNETQKADRDGL